MYSYSVTNQFKKAYKRCQKRGLPMEKLQEVIRTLVQTGTLPDEYHPHKLQGYIGNRNWDCHIQPDWLLIWEQYDEEFVLVMITTGSHSDLF